MHNSAIPQAIHCILFDYGGVIADEGFRLTLGELSLATGKSAAWLTGIAMDAVYRSGYVTGHGDEQAFWDELQKHFPLPEPSEAIRSEILRRFALRKEMIQLVRVLHAHGLQTAILSDQTDWLDELDQRDHFFAEFDHIFNSYHLGKGKRDPSLFTDIIVKLHLKPSQAIFIDDSRENVVRARDQGLHAILYENHTKLLTELEQLLGLELNTASN